MKSKGMTLKTNPQGGEESVRYRYSKKAIWLYGFALVVVGALVSVLAIPVWAVHLGIVGTSGTTPGHDPTETTRKAEDVRNTLHNLGDSILDFDNPNIVAAGGTNREVCVFCHTPHGANPSVTGAAPLWNRATNTGAYTTYSAPNMDNTPGQPVGVSLACLSCHDGTIALDALINMPGSGGFRGFTPTSPGLVTPEGATALIDAGGSMTETTRTDTGANYQAIAGGASPFPNLGTNIADDHPISMPMPVSTDPQFFSITFNQDGQVGLINKGSLLPPIDKRDALRTYPASGGGTWASPGWIECASCHNPHAPRPLFRPGVV